MDSIVDNKTGSPAGFDIASVLNAKFPCLPNNVTFTEPYVVKVVDGDTIDVEINDQVHRVRYIGIDTPESTTSIEPLGEQATLVNTEFVHHQIVKLVKDVSETDKYDRLLRYVLVGNTFVNYELVRRGFAAAITYPPDVACAETFLRAQQEARALGLGLWGAAVLIPTNSEPTITVLTRSRNCDPAYPDVCIPSPPPDLDCGDISLRRFRVLSPDPHNFDGDHDGIGCEN